MKAFWHKLWGDPANVISLHATIINFVLLIATAILAFYAFKQWKAVDLTLVEIKEQTPAVIASADAARDSAKLAHDESAASDLSTKKTLDLMQKQADAASDLAKTAKDSGAHTLELMRQQADTTSESVRIARNAAESSSKSAQEALALMKQQAEAAMLSAQSASDSVAASANQFAEAERPVLLLKLTAKPIITITKEEQLLAVITAKTNNIGKTPALETSLIAHIYTESLLSRLPVKEELEKGCDQESHIMKTPGIVIPQQSEPKELTDFVLAPFKSVGDRALAGTDFAGQRVAQFQLTVCVVYKDKYSLKPHRYAELFEVSLLLSPDEVQKLKSMPSQADKDTFIVPESRIVFSSDTFENGLPD